MNFILIIAGILEIPVYSFECWSWKTPNDSITVLIENEITKISSVMKNQSFYLSIDQSYFLYLLLKKPYLISQGVVAVSLEAVNQLGIFKNN